MTTSLILCLLVSAPELAGKWEIQTMGADRELEIQHKGNEIIAHRVMWPEFDGEKYKLEHLYRGKIRGNSISGKLLVKEDELPDFEVLRSFDGSISSTNSIVLDGMKVKRIAAQKKRKPRTMVADATPPPPPPPPAAAPSPPPAPSTPSASPTVVAQSEPAAPQDEGLALFDRIMGSPGMQDLFTVSNKIEMPDPQADIIAAGNRYLEKKKYKAALRNFEEAIEHGDGHRVELHHKMGKCYLALRNKGKAKHHLKKALKLDPNNKELKKDYRRAKKL